MYWNIKVTKAKETFQRSMGSWISDTLQVSRQKNMQKGKPMPKTMWHCFLSEIFPVQEEMPKYCRMKKIIKLWCYTKACHFFIQFSNKPWLHEPELKSFQLKKKCKSIAGWTRLISGDVNPRLVICLFSFWNEPWLRGAELHRSNGAIGFI